MIENSTPFERVFRQNYQTKSFDMTPYDPQFIKDKISKEDVERFLLAFIAIPPIKGTGCCGSIQHKDDEV